MSENKNYGSKRLVVGAHYGFRDWLSQRVTAALMAVFTLVLVAQVLFAGGRLDRGARVHQGVVRAVHAALGRRFLVLLNGHVGSFEIGLVSAAGSAKSEQN